MLAPVRASPRLLRALAGGATALVLLAAPSGSGAQTTLPVREAQGVRIVRDQGALVVVFTQKAAKLYRRIAGRIVEVECTEMDDGGTGAFEGESIGTVTMRAPRRGRRLATGDLTRGMDYCRVWIPRRTVRRGDVRIGLPRRLIVSVPLTQPGAVYLDEQRTARRLHRWLLLAGFVADERDLGRWPSYSELVGADPEPGLGAVALGGPGDTPPPGRVGYYSDSAEHVAVVALSRSGRRLFIEVDGDVVSTNVAGFVF